MADDKTIRGPTDRSRINVNEDYDAHVLELAISRPANARGTPLALFVGGSRTPGAFES